ncbi:hypothetical protein DRE_01452 [Drechslerella stenobrocha 248]|uniref:Senescence domain-containing protein n=1 Tax=Drechslerella stenobrocha 248 TaxID=1043628 RepID=W7I4B6_9PEZI|nr:hypothetical protein DRE_01452 [Drechslerella stenobrocha 248]
MATAPLVSIKNVKASHIPPDGEASMIPLKCGTLTLEEPLGLLPTEARLFLTVTPSSSSSTSSSRDTTPLVIPIHPDHFVGSKEGLCQVFRFEISDEVGAIEIAFPEDIPEEDALNFEKVMVHNGFLKTGLVADADDLAKKIAATATSVAAYLRGKTDERNEKAVPSNADQEFSDITKEIIGGVEDGTENLAEGSANVGRAISDAVYNAGAWVGEKTGFKGGATDNSSPASPSAGQQKSLPRETLDQTLEAGAIIGRQIGNGITTVGSEIGESASKVAEHDYGNDAKKLADSTRQTGANIGNVAKDVVVGTSVAINAATAGVGATKDDRKATDSSA